MAICHVLRSIYKERWCSSLNLILYLFTDSMSKKAIQCAKSWITASVWVLAIFCSARVYRRSTETSLVCIYHYLVLHEYLFLIFFLSLYLQKPIGIISLLDEAWYGTINFFMVYLHFSLGCFCSWSYMLSTCSMFPKSTHETFSTKLFQSFRGNPRIEKPKFQPTDFTISHYAGKVGLFWFLLLISLLKYAGLSWHFLTVKG